MSSKAPRSNPVTGSTENDTDDGANTGQSHFPPPAISEPRRNTGVGTSNNVEQLSSFGSISGGGIVGPTDSNVGIADASSGTLPPERGVGAFDSSSVSGTRRAQYSQAEESEVVDNEEAERQQYASLIASIDSSAREALLAPSGNAPPFAHEALLPPAAGTSSVSRTNTLQTSGTPYVTLQPGEYDVLYGRGKQHRNHPGNKRMQQIVGLHREAYNNADRNGKTRISKEIVKIIKSSGEKACHFLRHDKTVNGWVEVSDESAREKICHAMRDGKTKSLERIDPHTQEEIPSFSTLVRRAPAASTFFGSFPPAPGDALSQVLPTPSHLPFSEGGGRGKEEDRKPPAKEDETQKHYPV